MAFELCCEIRLLDKAGVVSFVRHDRLRDSLAVVAWESIASLFGTLTEAGGPARPATAATDGRDIENALRRRMRPIVGRLPLELRAPLGRMLRAQLQALNAAGAAATAAARLAVAAVRRRRARPSRLDTGDRARFEAEVGRDDMLFIPGAAFVHPRYPEFVAGLRARHGLLVALLVYDIIPVRRPEFVDAAFTESFGTWLDGMLPLCDRLMAISRSAADEAAAHAAARGIALKGGIMPIPIGTGFNAAAAPAIAQPHLPAPGTYALFVSTIEARKNHWMLFRVWRRLLDVMPAEEVPTLVFAGKPGWLTGDLMQQLRNTDFLGGHIRIVDQPSDAELAALYRGCLFTLFPSYYEGWGLPVSESLAFGKPCIISNATSLPEAGGDLARYFDPEDVPGATALIRATLENRDDLADWTRRVTTEFRPVSWQESARAVLEHLA